MTNKIFLIAATLLLAGCESFRPAARQASERSRNCKGSPAGSGQEGSPASAASGT